MHTFALSSSSATSSSMSHEPCLGSGLATHLHDNSLLISGVSLLQVHGQPTGCSLQGCEHEHQLQLNMGTAIALLPGRRAIIGKEDSKCVAGVVRKTNIGIEQWNVYEGTSTGTAGASLGCKESTHWR
eukprot:666889-Pelagomonas_calceolata.AAC.4